MQERYSFADVVRKTNEVAIDKKKTCTVLALLRASMVYRVQAIPYRLE